MHAAQEWLYLLQKVDTATRFLPQEGGETGWLYRLFGKPCGVEQRTEGILPVVGVPPGCSVTHKRVEGGH